MKLEFYILEDWELPRAKLEEGPPHVADLLQHELRGGVTARALYSVLGLLRSGELKRFSCGGNAASAQFEGTRLEISHESFDRPTSIEVDYDEFEKALQDWIVFLDSCGWGDKGTADSVEWMVQQCREQERLENERK